MNKCAVFGCDDRISPRHLFPNPNKYPQRFSKWLAVIKNPELEKLPKEQVYTSHRLCRKHFLPADISLNNRLFPTAIPKLFIPVSEVEIDLPQVGIDSTSELYRPGTSNRIDTCLESQARTHEIDDAKKLSIRKKYMFQVNTRISSVNPNEKRAMMEIKYLKKRLQYYRQQNLKKRLCVAQKYSSFKFLTEGFVKLNPLIARFFKSQILNACKKSKGRRFSFEDKLLALALYKQSGKGYRLLSKIFSLPTRKTLMALLNKIKIKPGMNECIFENLRSTGSTMSKQDKVCILIFDEMHLQPNLQYNKKTDVIEGFVDSGTHREEKIADHVLVFMIKGLFSKWKQPIAYSFSEGTTKSPLLVKQIKLVIRAIVKAGFEVMACICDQASTNIAAINTLIADTKARYYRKGDMKYERLFEIDGHTIIHLFDPPHLMKGVRK